MADPLPRNLREQIIGLVLLGVGSYWLTRGRGVIFGLFDVVLASVLVGLGLALLWRGVRR